MLLLNTLFCTWIINVYEKEFFVIQYDVRFFVKNCISKNINRLVAESVLKTMKLGMLRR